MQDYISNFQSRQVAFQLSTDVLSYSPRSRSHTNRGCKIQLRRQNQMVFRITVYVKKLSVRDPKQFRSG